MTNFESKLRETMSNTNTRASTWLVYANNLLIVSDFEDFIEAGEELKRLLHAICQA